MRKKVKSKTPMETPGLFAVTYEDNSVGYEFIPEGKSGEPMQPMDAKATPHYRNVRDAIKDNKTEMLEIGKHITKDDALRFAEESKNMSDEYKAQLIKELKADLVGSVNFNYKEGEEEEDIPDSPKGGGF